MNQNTDNEEGGRTLQIKNVGPHQVIISTDPGEEFRLQVGNRDLPGVGGESFVIHFEKLEPIEPLPELVSSIMVCEIERIDEVCDMGYWAEKLERNVLRDEENTHKLLGLGWKVLVVHECQLTKSKLGETLEALVEAIRQS